MSENEQHESRYPVSLSAVQRRIVAEFFPDLATRLKLDEPSSRKIELTVCELDHIRTCAANAAKRTDSGTMRYSLRTLSQAATTAIENTRGIGAIPRGQRVYQFKITLLGCKPAIWRRIQTKDCTLDRLHERIQTAMGWTNSHLHDFEIEGQSYGDPFLLDENFEEFDYVNSRMTKVSDIVPKSGEQLPFQYKYDFGDSWEHEILFEGCVPVTPGQRLPVCLGGARACPPEDVGGIGGYKEFIRILANPRHRERREYLEWVGGHFEPEEFDAEKVTRRMRRGLPDWRKME